MDFSISSLKNAADELRAQVYPRNETEKRVRLLCINSSVYVILNICRCMLHCPLKTGVLQLRNWVKLPTKLLNSTSMNVLLIMQLICLYTVVINTALLCPLFGPVWILRVGLGSKYIR